MQYHIWEVYDTRNGRRVAHCGIERDAINLSNMVEFRAYREYPMKTLNDQVIDVDNLYNPQIMPSQSRLDPSTPEPILITANEQQPLNFED